MIKQFVPEEFCLKCPGCCRFKEEDSVWSPCLLDEEIQALLDKKDLPAVFIAIDKKVKPIPNPAGEGFLCAFLEPKENKCRIYPFRPFECQLYPFLISLRNKKVLLTADLNCPYIKENLQSSKLKEYINYLIVFLNSPEQLKLLKNNPQILQAYEEVLDIMELNIADEAE